MDFKNDRRYSNLVISNRKVKKKYQAIVPGFKDHSHGFKIRKIEVNRDNYYFM